MHDVYEVHLRTVWLIESDDNGSRKWYSYRFDLVKLVFECFGFELS